jgi:hypothetical protein
LRRVHDVGVTAPPPAYAPYGDPARDKLYGLLFADDLEAFRPTGILSGAWARLFASRPDAAALAAIARDKTAESRLRILAWRRLAAAGGPMPPPASGAVPPEPPLLGVVVEVGLDAGLDALAAYDDGRVRYLNHAAGPAVFEGDPTLDGPTRALLDTAQPIAAAIGPWKEPRRPPPGPGLLRLTFLVGGELRFGEGPIDVLARDPMGGPVFAAAGRLLEAVAARATGIKPG